jgi:hypothetical protein
MVLEEWEERADRVRVGRGMRCVGYRVISRPYYVLRYSSVVMGEGAFFQGLQKDRTDRDNVKSWYSRLFSKW